MSKFGTMHGIAELLGRRRFRIVAAGIGVIRFVAIGAPVAFVFAGFGVKDNYAVVAVAVGNVELVGFGIDECLGRQPQVVGVVAAFTAARFADLHQEFSILRKFKHHIVVEAAEATPAGGGSSAGSSAGLGRLFIA